MKKPLSILLASAVLAWSGITTAAEPVAAFPPGSGYELGLSPGGTALEVVLQGIEVARAQILVAAYSFTSRPIAQALVQASKRGVKVYVVADQRQNSKQYSAVTFLANQGIPVRLNDRYQDMHDKFMVIDGEHVETGSFNYSASAAKKNAENALLLINAKPLAARYGAEWSRLWQEGTPVKPNY